MSKKLHIVNQNGQLVSYQGKYLIFEVEDKERAEQIAWLASRNATSGPFEVKEVNE